MFFLFSKLLSFLLAPAVWLVALLLAAWLARPAGRWRGCWLGLALLLALVGTNRALVNAALLAWELPPVPLAAVAPADAAVLLTGVAQDDKSPHDRVYLSQGADRVTNALWLYRAGKVRYIIISGGSGAVLKRASTEAAGLRTLLRLAAVPDSVLLMEDKSRNTRENALYTQRLLKKHPRIKSLVLITSAFHERRALACFRRVGLHPQPFPADYRSIDPQPTPAYWLVPDASALTRWTLLLHEIGGYLAYKATGRA